MKINLYLTDLKISDLKVNIAIRELEENPYSKKYISKVEKAKKEQKEAFEKFANEFSRVIKKERSDKFDLYIRMNLEKIEELINTI